MKRKRTPLPAVGTVVPITIQGKQFMSTIADVPHEDLKYYLDNPRVFTSLRGQGEKTPSQEEIEEHLQTLEHVKELKQDIKENGGIIEPLYVSSVTLEVYEGNSRLAASRLLANEDSIRWQTVRCAILPEDISESEIKSLLGTLHLKGKKDWTPYERASFLYRRHHQDNVSIPDLIKELRLSAKSIRHDINVIRFMRDHREDVMSRFSYYNEYLKNRKITKAREDHAELDTIVVRSIKTGLIAKAAELRDKLPTICSAKSKTPLKTFLRDGTLDNAHKTAQSHGADNKLLKQLSAFREKLSQPGVRKALRQCTGEQKTYIVNELRVIREVAASLLKVT